MTNGSGVTLTGVTVTDDFTDAAPGSTAPTPVCVSLSNPVATCSGTSTTLLDGQVATFAASYTTTQDDLEHGGITDVATASGTPPTGGPLEGTSNSVIVTGEQSPSVSLEKIADPTTVDGEGDLVDYTFTVTNTGNVTLTGIEITESEFTGSGTPRGDRLPGGSAPAGRRRRLHRDLRGDAGGHGRGQHREHRDGIRHRPRRLDGRVGRVDGHRDRRPRPVARLHEDGDAG